MVDRAEWRGDGGISTNTWDLRRRAEAGPSIACWWWSLVESGRHGYGNLDQQATSATVAPRSPSPATRLHVMQRPALKQKFPASFGPQTGARRGVTVRVPAISAQAAALTTPPCPSLRTTLTTTRHGPRRSYPRSLVSLLPTCICVPNKELTSPPFPLPAHGLSSPTLVALSPWVLSVVLSGTV